MISTDFSVLQMECVGDEGLREEFVLKRELR